MTSRTADDASDSLSTAEGPKPDLSALPKASFHLTVTEGPDAGRTFELDGSQPARALVGKSPACDVCLSDPQVSRRHLALDLDGRRLHVNDLGSTNGSAVDGVALIDGYAAHGSVLRLGATVIRIEYRIGRTAPPASTASAFGRVIGASNEMRRMYRLCERLAATTVPTLIEGETGTGKEALAESLHEMGPRAAAPFVVFDCTAVAPNLVESELFGHERGAFTGAAGTRKGVFEEADGGTLLIDEIGDLDLSLQPKLLRAIERSEFRRIGSSRPLKVDVRILAATRRDLDHEVQAGRFRDDLFHRLAVARVELPPLRRRKGDVPLLAGHFCKALGVGGQALPNDLVQRWNDDPWPGNVRELRNAVARWLALGDLAEYDARGSETAKATDSPSSDFIDRVVAMGLPLSAARQRVIDEFEQRYIPVVLAQHGGNVARAAAASGIARRYFQILKARQGK